MYGLGYSLLVFVYRKSDDSETRSSRLNTLHTVYIDKLRTGDYQTTHGITDILNRNGNADDLFAFIKDRNLPVDDIQATRLADEIIGSPPELGYLTISNAQQWRLQYKRTIEIAGEIDGVVRVE